MVTNLHCSLKVGAFIWDTKVLGFLAETAQGISCLSWSLYVVLCSKPSDDLVGSVHGQVGREPIPTGAQMRDLGCR